MPYLSDMIARLDDDGRITDSLSNKICYTSHSAQWLFIVSTALSFQFNEERSDNLIDNDVFGFSNDGETFWIE